MRPARSSLSARPGRQRGMWIVDVVMGLVAVSVVIAAALPVVLTSSDMALRVSEDSRLDALADAAAERLIGFGEFPPCGATATEVGDCPSDRMLDEKDLMSGYSARAKASPVEFDPEGEAGTTSAGDFFMIEGVVRSPSGRVARFSRLIGRE
jgi:hypothetical protein